MTRIAALTHALLAVVGVGLWIVVYWLVLAVFHLYLAVPYDLHYWWGAK